MSFDKYSLLFVLYVYTIKFIFFYFANPAKCIYLTPTFFFFFAKPAKCINFAPTLIQSDVFKEKYFTLWSVCVYYKICNFLSWLQLYLT